MEMYWSLWRRLYDRSAVGSRALQPQLLGNKSRRTRARTVPHVYPVRGVDLTLELQPLGDQAEAEAWERQPGAGEPGVGPCLASPHSSATPSCGAMKKL